MGKLSFIIGFLLSIPIIFAISNVQHSTNQNQVTITFQGVPPFYINIRNDNNIGQPGGYIWARTYQNYFTYDMGFAANPSGNYQYSVRDAAWSSVNTFNIGHPICTDTDGGLDYYVKGEITGPLASNPDSPKEDICVDDSVRELFCNYEGKGEPTIYYCPNGCQDGACLPAPAPTLSINPPSQAASVGDRFNINVNINGVDDLYSAPFYLTYDSTRLRVVGAQDGGFLGGTFIPESVPDTDGSFIVGNARFTAPGVSGSGTLVTITLEAIGAGESQLGFTNVDFVNSQNNPVSPNVIDGRVTIS